MGSSSVGPPYDQNRRHRRYRVTAFADLRGPLQYPALHVQNISQGGLCLHTPDLVPKGTHVELVITFPDLDETFECEGRVTWVSEDGRMDMGIQFQDLDDARRQVLQQYIDLVNQRR